MFSISIGDNKTFFDFLNSSDLDFVDVYLHDEVTTMIMNTSDLFCVLLLKSTHTPGETSHSFRLPRNLLKQQKSADVISVRFSESGDEVSVSFLSGNTMLCDATFIYQKVYSTSYEDRLKLIKGYHKPYSLKLESISPLVKLSNTLGGLLNLESGVASAIFTNGIHVYKKVNYNENLCITPKNAQILQKCDDNIFSIENYVGAFNGSFAILVNKLRVSSNAEFRNLDAARTQYRAEIDFSNLISFACSHPMKITNFQIDLDNRSCSVLENDIRYRLPIAISNEVRAKADTVHELNIPFSIIRNMLPTIGAAKVLVEKKQFFTCITSGDYKIMFN